MVIAERMEKLGSVYKKGVGVNPISCVFCEHWVHKKGSGTKGRLRCIKYIAEIRPLGTDYQKNL